MSLSPTELQLGRGESIADTARSLSGYCAAIVIRTFAQSTVDELARWATVPVVNALSNEHHPCQALADLMTLRERFGSIEGRVLAYVGDGNNVARSLAVVGALAAPLFQTYLVPFEITSVLLLVAVIGAVVLAKRKL